MASMKDIKLRIKSVESTMQITKAMELVASSKLRKAKEKVEKSRPYFQTLYKTLNDIAASNTDFSSTYLVSRQVNKTCYVIIAGDRGLAGGYNNNMFKAFMAHKADNNFCVLPIGKKAIEFCKRRNMDIVTERYSLTEDITPEDCSEIANTVAKLFKNGEVDEVYIGYTTFVSMLSQQPEIMKALPIVSLENTPKEKASMLTTYEPEVETLFDLIVPEYISGLLYGSVAESWSSELGARRTAMDSASKNAGEMVATLSLQYNRARQAAITQEITEIVAGSSAD